jgi:hypothetical protein
MKVVDPVILNDAMLISTNVAENDEAPWSDGVTYALGDRVMRSGSHRIYESAIDGNLARDPIAADGFWLDAGPTNRWAMFDLSVGTVTTGTGSITFTLAPGAIDSFALLDVVGATVRVRMMNGSTQIYNQLKTLGTRSLALFLGLPRVAGAQVIVTVTGASGSSPVAVGTALGGNAFDLGMTEASPSIGITDYSRRQTDDFGVTTIVPRAWAKQMGLRAQLDSDEVDNVQRVAAAVRAKVCLWIGDEGFDSLIILGFFKEFSIDLALPPVSFCSLRIDGVV